jgi:hypothetical protein
MKHVPLTLFSGTETSKDTLIISKIEFGNEKRMKLLQGFDQQG